MATSQNFVTLGELFARNSDEEDEELFAKVKIIIERSLPDGWRDWKAELFRKAVEPLRTSVCSRERISDALSSDVESHRNRIRNYSRSISHDENSQTRANMTRPIKRKRPRRQLSSSDENVNPSPARVCYYSTSPERSPPKRKCLSSSSSHSPKESSAETRLDRMEDMMQRLFEMMSSNKENENEPEISSWRTPSPLLVSPSENPPKEMVDNWDIFSPSTKESEPAIPRANPILEEQGLKCQRLGETTWNKIRYSEAQKKLHASPVFNCLRVNATLQQYSYPSQIKDLLGKCDSAFGTITHGLLAQRLKLQEALKKVADQHPDAADTLKKALMAENEFRSLSDDLLQYSCGKRAEIIEYRRKLYEPKNKYYRSFLEEIPPTGTHLWDEEKLQLAIKTHGISKIAPAPRRPVLDYTGKNNKWKQPRDSNNTKKSFQGVKKFKRPEFKPRPQTQRPQTSKDQKHDSFKERSAAGQLATHVAAWRNLGAPKSIISIIKGYVIPFSEKPPITPWQQAKSILGKMEFASFVIPLARLHCRKIQRAVNHLPEFKPNAPFKIKTDVIQELKWWIANLDQNSNIIVKEPEIYLVTDASNTGWGAELKDRLISGLWTIPQRKWHINKKEMFVVFKMLSRYQNLLQDKSILIQSDNKTVVAYLRNQGGTKSMKLLKLTGDILDLAKRKNMEIQIEHIPGHYNHILKGISNSSPQAPRAKIWDINKLLAWLRHNPPDESNLFQVSRHLAILLLLSSGRRVHDLTLLRIDSGFIVQSENEVIFWPQYGSKTDKTKYIQSGWKLIKNKEQLWNIVYWIKLYIELSHQRRHPDGKIIPSLFVTTRGKTGPASRSVIAGWVRTALLSAGIEAGAGSTRSAVATFRFNNCVPLDELLKKGNWQGPDNFFKHYYKEIDKSPPCDDSNDKIMITESFVPL
ncbi:putative transposon Ty3-I Gag-Pol polyprotein [Operophtera brumata]|uniref:Putative transposon Ty3-I Gag-Pol polyprotein n=1 Tax=Operophtera brumata TaxID=104452 RepID=A0A0L7KR66_OPEBR|nr:putative transposon Ty3-I Gag-Pol polyprotein [Operophtera brumata]